MPTVTHAFVSAKSDGADATLVRPSDWNAGHTVSGDGYDVGTITVATAQFLLQYRHMILSGTERLTIAGTAEVYITGLGADDTVVYLGSPKRFPTSFTIANDYFLDQLYRLELTGVQRMTLLGTADLVLTDDFGARSRIVLAGRGG